MGQIVGQIMKKPRRSGAHGKIILDVYAVPRNTWRYVNMADNNVIAGSTRLGNIGTIGGKCRGGVSRSGRKREKNRHERVKRRVKFQGRTMPKDDR